MENQALAERMEATLLPDWELIPDFGLYMDQIISFADKSAGPDGSGLTKPMVNNYVKSGLVDRPVGKTYTRESIAQLLMICRLKQVLSQEELRRLLHGEKSTEELYGSYRREQMAWQEELKQGDEPTREPLSYAIQAAACHTICRMLLQETAD